jgi:hypothetical protein
MEPTAPQWEVTVRRKNATPVPEVEDPPRISSDPSAPRWAPVSNRPYSSILTRLSGHGAESYVPESEEDITARILQFTTDLLNEPSDDDQDLTAPVFTMSQEQAPVPLETSVEHTEGINMQLEDGLDGMMHLDDEDRLSQCESGDYDLDWEVTTPEYVVMETEGPQAAQSGVIYPAASI